MKKINTIITKTEIESNNSIIDNKALENLQLAGKIIREGGLVAFPTETVYGLGGDALNPQSSLKIYKAKGRPSDNPLIVHIAEIKEIYKLVAKVPKEAEILMEKFWPGPMTIILPKSNIVPYETTGGLDTVAIRLPDNLIARELIKFSKRPIAAPSANISGKPSPTKAAHVINDLSGIIDMIIDGGNCRVGLESTIIDLSTDIPAILRPGYITVEDIKKYLPNCIIDPAIINMPIKNSLELKESSDLEKQLLKPKAPGMKYKHYAPNAPITIIESNDYQKICKRIYDETINAVSCHQKIGIISSQENFNYYSEKFDLEPFKIDDNITYYENKEKGIVVHIFGEQKNPESIAHNLFDILRAFDNEKVNTIFSEGVTDNLLGVAIKNRLYKAAAYNIVKI